jgi:hypothetical protein
LSTDDFIDDDEQNDDESGDQDESANLRQLRKAAREGKAAQKRAEELERELAFTKAGIPESTIAGYFRKGYEGDLTADAVKAAAIEAGLIEKPADDGSSESADERDAHEKMRDALGGGDEVNPPGYLDELEAAKTPEEALAVMEKFGQQVAAR